MATRRDQLQSYQFLTQRVISAFVMRETDPAQSPLRRGIGAVFGGLMIAVVVAAGFGVYGILTKVGGDAWKADGSVVIEKETGASFVYFGGQLHPTLNYASALLAAGRPGPAVFRVANKSLASVPRGVTVGIPGAPNSLPPANKRVGLPWTICAVPGTDSAGKTISTVTLVVGDASTGGQPLGDRGMLVRDASSGSTYLVWHGHRHVVQQSRTVVPALFGAVVTTVPAGTAWLNTLPSGVDIAPITVNDRGKPSAGVPGRTIGDVLIAGPGHYLVFDDGVAPITALQEAILAAQAPVQPITVAVSETTSAKRSSRLVQPSGDVQAPQSAPPLATPSASDLLCATTRDVKSSPEIWVGGTVAGLDNASPTGSVTVDGVRLADRVLVPAGRVAIVRVLSSPSAETGAYYVVTDLGIRYAVPSQTVLRMLGYLPDHAVGVPSTLVTRIPAGPALDPATATKVATAASGN
jgi:type VII secretion protein EccB